MTDSDDEDDSRLAGQEQRHREREQRDTDDIRQVMSTDAGRRVIWWLLERGKVFSTTFHADPHIAAFNEGQRNLALAMFSRVMAASPDNYLLMAAEASKEE
ncbi:hypothetical protein ABKE32_000486 [Escherichia albertii]|uniref:Bbp19 family protein n=1 Tax=Escherichia albertii TaxID=208962 RepID=UPI000743F20E|nr:hypothetical protein [Escherichia albertii]